MNNKIYLVMKRIDLGSEVVSAFKNRKQALVECDYKNSEYKKQFPWMEETYFVKEIKPSDA